ncbi:MAG TPA: MFS transporter [Thermodesulfobacteriota bacterium]
MAVSPVWPIVAAGFVSMAVSGLIWHSFSLFLVALEREFGWSRATISGAYTLFTIVNALGAPAVGWLLPRVDSRAVLGIASLLLAGGLLLASRVESAAGFYLAFGLVAGAGVQACSTLALFTILANWLGPRAAPGMSLVDSGSGIGVFLGLPALHAVIEAAGWRAAYVGLGVLVLVTVLPMNAILMRYGPPGFAAAAAAARRDGSAPAAKRPGMAWIGVAFFLGPVAFHGLMTQQVALFQDQGVEAAAAVWIASATGLCVFAFRFAAGFVVSRFGETAAMAAQCVAAALAVGCLLLLLGGAGSSVLYAYPVLLGAGFGPQAIVLALGTRRLVAPADFGVAYGVLRLVGGAGMAVGPSLAAGVFDVTGSYAAALVLLVVMVGGQYLSYRTALARA